MAELWDTWVPGVLNRSQMQLMSDKGFITGVIDPSSIDESSIDLHLSGDGYELVEGSVKPFGGRFIHELTQTGLAQRLPTPENGEFVLHPKRTYLFRIRERLEELNGSSIWGQATAKSSIGRIDVLARLVVNGMKHYEGFNPTKLGRQTEMFVEVTPITFPVRVREGCSLNQLRLFYGNPESSLLQGEEISRTCFAGSGDGTHNLTVSLDNSDVYGANGCGFCAVEGSTPDEPIPLWKDDDTPKPDPARWWKLVRSDENQRLRIKKNSFYILKSYERLTVPPGIAVYARAIDEEIGEMRIHYAGFAHPHFGWERADDMHGTPLIFEVRGHDVDVNLRHREVLARLKFFRMSQDPDSSGSNAYNEQELKLSSYFDDWTSKPTLLVGDEASPPGAAR